MEVCDGDSYHVLPEFTNKIKFCSIENDMLVINHVIHANDQKYGFV